MSEIMNYNCCANTCNPDDQVNQTYTTVGYQLVNVSVPVTIVPFAHAGCAKVTCYGEPVVSSCDMPCSGTKNGTCAFTVSQTLCVELPIEFGAAAAVEDTFVDCLTASSHESFESCTCETPEA